MLLFGAPFPKSITLSYEREATLAPGMYQAHTENEVDARLSVGSEKYCPFAVSLDVPAPVCVKTAAPPPVHAPLVCVVGAVVDGINAPRGLGALSARMLDESKV